jgi:hypothetical protein
MYHAVLGIYDCDKRPCWEEGDGKMGYSKAWVRIAGAVESAARQVLGYEVKLGIEKVVAAGR